MVVILMLMNGDKILGDVVESESDVKNEIISIKTPFMTLTIPVLLLTLLTV